MAVIHGLHGIAAIYATPGAKMFLFPQAVAQQKKKAELFYKERLGVLAARCASCISMTNF